jgi:hypothetical protein
MSLQARLKQQSTLTGLSACLFVGGLVFFFVALYHDAARSGPLLWIAGLLLIATIACWIAAARARNPASGAP